MKDDAISRQAAIDAVAPFDDEYRIRDAIEDLPSAEPEHLTDDDFASTQSEKRTDKRAEMHACDLISRQAAIDEANAWLLDCLGVHKQNRSCGLIRRLEDLPSVQPERKRGKWIDDGDPFMWECGCCGYRVKRYNNTRYCPNCGADMRGEADE